MTKTRRYTLHPYGAGHPITLEGSSLTAALYTAGMDESAIFHHSVQFHAGTAPEPCYALPVIRGAHFQQLVVQTLGGATAAFRRVAK